MVNIIEVKNLNKQFEFKVKNPSSGFLKNLFWPDKKSIQAVNNVSFAVKPGETVAFIGPNGAGKSTTIKMLTGILWPSSGQISVLDLNPQEQRKQLAKNLGTVFGQRSQLLFNLPIAESFNLFAKVYDLDKKKYLEQKEKLFSLFNLTEITNQPVRKLSLGQRMRAEVAISLLHRPPIIFLDEPTIGLDIVAKQNLREVLKKVNEEFGTTIFLTSHDAGDIESVCKRTIIINFGQIIFDDSTEKLKKQYINQKVVNVQFQANQKIDLSKYFKQIKVELNKKGLIKFIANTDQISIGQILKDIVQTEEILDITVEDPPLEEIIRKIYLTKNL